MQALTPFLYFDTVLTTDGTGVGSVNIALPGPGVYQLVTIGACTNQGTAGSLAIFVDWALGSSTYNDADGANRICSISPDTVNYMTPLAKDLYVRSNDGALTARVTGGGATSTYRVALALRRWSVA